MSNLAKKWSTDSRHRTYSIPVSIRLRPEIDCKLQEIQSEFPHLTMTQIITDLLADSISRLKIDSFKEEFT